MIFSKSHNFRSDLTALDFFRWDHVKDIVYANIANKANIIDQLKTESRRVKWLFLNL